MFNEFDIKFGERNAIYPGTLRAGIDRALKFVAFQSRG